jgi:hypothetical protein
MLTVRLATFIAALQLGMPVFGQVGFARVVNISEDRIRHHLRTGSFPEPKRRDRKGRLFSRSEVARLCLIRAVKSYELETPSSLSSAAAFNASFRKIVMPHLPPDRSTTRCDECPWEALNSTLSGVGQLPVQAISQPSELPRFERPAA